jgi:hypothetical protein
VEGKEETLAKFVGALEPSWQKGASATLPGFLEFIEGSGFLEGEGSNGAVLARAEGEFKVLGFDHQELIDVRNP